MDKTHQRSAIAEACISQFVCCRCSTTLGKKTPATFMRYGAPFCSDECAERASDWTLEDGQRDIPDYLNDLNVMHDVEMSLSDVPPAPEKPSDRARYRMNLCTVSLMAGGPIHATAAQRAEAFLKTIGKWDGE